MPSMQSKIPGIPADKTRKKWSQLHIWNTEKKVQPTLDPAKISFKTEGPIKGFQKNKYY